MINDKIMKVSSQTDITFVYENVISVSVSDVADYEPASRYSPKLTEIIVSMKNTRKPVQYAFI